MLPLTFIEDEIMGWAKEHEPAAHAQTLGVQEQRRTYRRYMQRLVEIRYESDRGWNPPLRLLEDTNVEAEFKTDDGTIFTVSGRRCPGLRKMSWTLLAILTEQDRPLASLKAAMQELDLYVADRDRDEEWPAGPVIEVKPQAEPMPVVLCTGPGVGRWPNRCPGKRAVTEGLDTCAQCAQTADTKQGDLIDG